MKKRPRFIAVSTQKGGVGKTTFTVLAASYLHYARDYNVLLVDCDYPLHSIQQMRKRDSEMLDRSQILHEMAIELFSRIEKPTFKILCAKPEECVDDALRFIEDSDDEFDFVFFDLAGTFNNDGIIRALAQVDYIFTPIAADDLGHLAQVLGSDNPTIRDEARAVNTMLRLKDSPMMEQISNLTEERVKRIVKSAVNNAPKIKKEGYDYSQYIN